MCFQSFTLAMGTFLKCKSDNVLLNSDPSEISSVPLESSLDASLQEGVQPGSLSLPASFPTSAHSILLYLAHTPDSEEQKPPQSLS